jgi:hypothetical protein
MQITSKPAVCKPSAGTGSARAGFKTEEFHFGPEAVQALGIRSWLRCGLGFVAYLAMLINDGDRD